MIPVCSGDSIITSLFRFLYEIWMKIKLLDWTSDFFLLMIFNFVHNFFIFLLFVFGLFFCSFATRVFRDCSNFALYLLPFFENRFFRFNFFPILHFVLLYLVSIQIFFLSILFLCICSWMESFWILSHNFLRPRELLGFRFWVHTYQVFFSLVGECNVLVFLDCVLYCFVFFK